jgi:glycosyltransferase involved in cell wall biosynthesis
MNPLFGGAQERVFQMSKYLGNLGVRVDTLTTKYQIDRDWVGQLQSGEVFVLNALHCRYLYPIGAEKWLRKNLHRYDAIHIAKNWCLLGSATAKVATEMGIPYIFSGMGFVSIHNRSKILKKVFTQLYAKPILKNANYCIAVTAEERDDLLANGVSDNKIHVIPNGIVPTNFSCIDDEFFRNKYGIGNKKIILFIGRMDPIKGVHLLVEAFRKVIPKISAWCLVLVGTNTAYRIKLEAYIKSSEMEESVIFIDPIFGDEKSIAYHAADFVVVPSIKDAMTIIAPEAAYCKRPVLITKSSGFQGLLHAGGSVEVEASVESIAKGLLTMCDGSIDLNLMGLKGNKYITDNFDWEVISKKYLDILTSCIIKD